MTEAIIFFGVLALLIIGLPILDRWHARRAWREANLRAREIMEGHPWGITHDAMPSPKDHVITKPERRAGGE